MLSRYLISTLWRSRYSNYASTISTINSITTNKHICDFKNPSLFFRDTPVCQLHESCIHRTASKDQTASDSKDKPASQVPSHSNIKSSKPSSGSPRKLQKMPNSLTNMLLTEGSSLSWPEFKTVSTLARRCGYAGVTIEEVEMYLLANYRAKGGKGNKNSLNNVHKEPNFYSLHIINYWNKEDKVLEKMFKYFESILQSEKTGLPIKRLEYCMAIWRLASIVQDCFSKNLDQEIQLLLKFSKEMEDKYNDKTLSILLFLGGIGQTGGVGAWNDQFLSDISGIIKNIAKESLKKQPHQNQMPSLLLFENSEEIILNMLERNPSPLYQLELQSYLCQVQWSNRSFSLSLDTLSKATNTFLDAVDEDVEEGAKVGVALVEAWHAIAVSALRLKMTPAIEYMITLAEMTAIKDQNGVAFLPGYVFWLTAKESSSGSQVALALETKIGGIKKLSEAEVITAKENKFRRVFIVEGMTNETKAFFIKDFIMSLAKQKTVIGTDSLTAPGEETELCATNVQQVVAEENQVPPSLGQNEQVLLNSNVNNLNNKQVLPQTSVNSEEVLENNAPQQSESNPKEKESNSVQTTVDIDEQLLTIKIIEAVTQDNIKEAVDIVLKEARDGRDLEEAVSALVSSLSKSGDLHNLDQLARVLHPHHPSMDAIYGAVIGVRLKGVMQKWESGDHKSAWDKFLLLYTEILQDSCGGRVLLHTSDKAVERCKRYGKIFIEETVGKNEEELVKYMRKQVVDLYNSHGDLSFMSAYWEACFFSNRFTDQETASDLLHEFPELVGDIVKIDPVIDRAERYGIESLHRNLIEVCLRHNLSPYHKSRAFEGLLMHQIRQGNVNSAAQTFNTAKSLDIRITADYLQDFFRLKFRANDQEENLNIGFFQSIKNIFKKK